MKIDLDDRLIQWLDLPNATGDELRDAYELSKRIEKATSEEAIDLLDSDEPLTVPRLKAVCGAQLGCANGLAECVSQYLKNLINQREREEVS